MCLYRCKTISTLSTTFVQVIKEYLFHGCIFFQNTQATVIIRCKHSTLNIFGIFGGLLAFLHYLLKSEKPDEINVWSTISKTCTDDFL